MLAFGPQVGETESLDALRANVQVEAFDVLDHHLG